MPESLKIIENGLVVTCDAHRRVVPMALLVRNDRIAEIAPHAESFRVRYPGAEVLDASGRVVVPGFVDAHYHGESFILRHWTTSVPCGDWMHHPKTRVILSHVHRELSAERLGIFYRLAYFAALRAGITFVNIRDERGRHVQHQERPARAVLAADVHLAERRGYERAPQLWHARVLDRTRPGWPRSEVYGLRRLTRRHPCGAVSHRHAGGTE